MLSVWNLVEHWHFSEHFVIIILLGFYAYQFSGHAKSLLSVVHDVQENDQRLTMLQLVDKMKVKNKGVG